LAQRIRATTSLRLRIGLHTGPVVAGVIGKRKFIYDLWTLSSRPPSGRRPSVAATAELPTEAPPLARARGPAFDLG
jgi:adenylate cyclase